LLRGVVFGHKLIHPPDHIRHGEHLFIDLGNAFPGFRVLWIRRDFAAFAAISRYKTRTVAEGDYCTGTVVRTVFTNLTGLIVPIEGARFSRPINVLRYSGFSARFFP